MLIVEFRDTGNVGVAEPAILVQRAGCVNREKAEEVTEFRGPSGSGRRASNERGIVSAFVQCCSNIFIVGCGCVSGAMEGRVMQHCMHRYLIWYILRWGVFDCGRVGRDSFATCA